MNIQEAARRATQKGGGIYRPTMHTFYIIPTNTSSCCIFASMKNEKLEKRWQPSLGDLIADDWEVYGEYPSEPPFEQPLPP